MATIYPDRFDLNYLQFLSEQLELKTLMENSINELKRDESGGKINRIQITYCGIASNTLLGNETYARGASSKPEVSKAKKLVEKNFKNLFAPSTLNKLIREGYYLKVRFCFAYVYSDFPVCLINAEDSDNWNNIKDGTKYDYHYTKPINFYDLKKGSIYKSQEASLQIIKDILKRANSAGHDLATWEKERHSIHIRFTVMPTPICVLIINDNIALCDAYLYGMLQNEEKNQENENIQNGIPNDKSSWEDVVSLHYPMSIIKSEEDNAQFVSIQNHFKYLWRHDLTLFCGDGTGFRIKAIRNGKRTYDFEGLTSITPPHKVKWKDKIHRIKESKTRNGLPQSSWLWIHFVWKPRLTNKLKLSTSKVISNSFLGRFINNMKNNMLLWFVATFIIFVFFFLYFLFAKEPNISVAIEWFSSHAAFEILKSSVLFLAMLIIQSLLASRE